MEFLHNDMTTILGACGCYAPKWLHLHVEMVHSGHGRDWLGLNMIPVAQQETPVVIVAGCM